MKITIFLDTNIFVNNYSLQSPILQNLLKLQKSESPIKYNLALTKMNYHEVLDKAFSSIRSAINKKVVFIEEMSNIIPIEQINKKAEVKKISDEYMQFIETNFYIHDIERQELYKAVFDRFYQNKMPFRENKKEFKDAMIWETVFDYALNRPDEVVYFVSQNVKDFAKEYEGQYALHEHYEDLAGQIKFFESVTKLLQATNYLVETDHFLDDLETTFTEYILDDLKEDIDLLVALETFLNSNFYISEEGFEGFGVDPYIFEVSQYDFIDNSLETSEFLHQKVEVLCLFEFSVRIKNPTYEKWENEEFIDSEPIYAEALIDLVIVYNKTTLDYQIDQINIEKINV